MRAKEKEKKQNKTKQTNKKKWAEGVGGGGKGWREREETLAHNQHDFEELLEGWKMFWDNTVTMNHSWQFC